MNFDYSEEQIMLQDSITRLLADSNANAGGEMSWKAFAELGILGMTFSEADGGLGSGPVESMIVMRAIGGGLCAAPFLASSVYGAEILKSSKAEELRSALVAGLSDGSCQLAVAHAEPGSRFRLAHVGVTAKADDADFILDGRKTLVLGGSTATHFIVSARLSGAVGDKAGLALFLVERASEGVEVTTRRTIDGRTADIVDLKSVRVAKTALMAGGDDAYEVLEHATTHATVACLNEAIGAMEALSALTVEYLKTRQQFGTTIGSFQALQHKMVDVFVEVEQAKAMALYAVMQLDRPVEDRRDGIGLAKLYVNRAARMVGETAVQLHGGIGMTMESKAGRLFNRLTACQMTFGDSDYWLNCLLESEPNILAA